MSGKSKVLVLVVCGVVAVGLMAARNPMNWRGEFLRGAPPNGQFVGHWEYDQDSGRLSGNLSHQASAEVTFGIEPGGSIWGASVKGLVGRVEVTASSDGQVIDVTIRDANGQALQTYRID